MDMKRKIVIPALAGAVYAALTMVLAPISYGPVQFRVSEVLCILPFFLPGTAWGLFLGCALANIISPLGLMDIFFGSAATLLAGLSTAAIGRSWRRSAPEPALRETGGLPSLWTRIWACLMPVIWNGVIIGAELAYVFMRENFWLGYATNAAWVALGEAVVMLALGLPLMSVLLRSPRFTELFQNNR
jgi:uncharacterized membrane protein